ncbi:alpha/beta hydrolase [Nonomuraea angiospora]|uniref:alpha/beta fold hydrolase n=1 Tax=Nonomuraea angiospora TaxID=46172 RepID=UPI0033D2D81B
MSKRAVVARALRRVAAWCAAVAALAAVTGFCYESVARQGDPPAPGRLVDVGGHRLHVRCTGSGAPTVVLEAGLAESSASWDAIQRGLPGRVCAYDRAGYAWSQDGPAPRTADRAAAELRALLAAAGEAGPYVLVGHSYGGTIVRLFAHRWPALTAGLVLIDVTDENATEALQVSRPLLAAQFTVNQALARVGVLRLFGDALVPADATAAARASAPVVYGAGSMGAARAEAWAAADSAAQVRATVRPGRGATCPSWSSSPRGSPRRRPIRPDVSPRCPAAAVSSSPAPRTTTCSTPSPAW